MKNNADYVTIGLVENTGEEGCRLLFNSLQFLIFFPVVVILYFAIPQRGKYIWLLAASYFFYMCWNPRYALLMLASTMITYASGLAIERFRKIENHRQAEALKKSAVAVSFVLNLAILVFFKYFYFIFENIKNILLLWNIQVAEPAFDIVLPVGISFYTFQALSYTMDVYRGEIYAERNFCKYALFVSFFPQLVAGPIERSKNLLVQISKPHKFEYNRVRRGLLLMLWGFFQKLVIADRAAVLVNQVYNHSTDYGGMGIIIATLLFALQIYCDFSSYTDIARGAAEVMGFHLMKNFQQPYFSKSIAEFWRNWHISLSSWFKDYLYIPLGGNKRGAVRKYINVMIVFLVSGLWHGASWHFVFWGFLHGLYQVLGALFFKIRIWITDRLNIARQSHAHHLFQRVFTFVLVCFAWIFFRADNLSVAVDMAGRIFTQFDPWILTDGTLFQMGLDGPNFFILALSAGVLFCVSCAQYYQKSPRDGILSSNLIFRWCVYFALLFAVLIFGIYGPQYSASQFIYFQF